MAWMIASLTFATVVTSVLFAASLSQKRERLVAERLARVTLQQAAASFRPEVEGGLFRRVVRPALERLAGLAGRFTPVGTLDAMRKRLQQAGNPWGLQPAEFLAAKVLLMAGAPAAVLMFLPGGEGGSPVLRALLGLAFAALLPELVIRQRIEARQKEITRGLPDVLDLLTVSVEAGLGFDSSVAKVVEKSQGAIAEEFRRMLQEMRMGKPRRDALRDLGTRTGVPDMIAFTVALVQADQLGVSIGRVLRVQSEEMRRKRRQRAEEAAMKAPIKMLFPLVIFIFPTLFVILLGPALIQVASIFIGNP